MKEGGGRNQNRKILKKEQIRENIRSFDKYLQKATWRMTVKKKQGMAKDDGV